MRWITGLIAVLLLFAAISPAVRGDESRGAAVRPKQQCIIFCGASLKTTIITAARCTAWATAKRRRAWPGLDIAVKDIKQSDGATVDVTLAPGAGARKIHVVKFVKFDGTLVIPLDEKAAKGAVRAWKC